MSASTLTFTGWSNYTDGNGAAHTLSWASYEALRGQWSYPYLEAIRQALNERTAPFGYRLGPAVGIDDGLWSAAVIWSAVAFIQDGAVYYSHLIPTTEAADTELHAAWSAAVAAGSVQPDSDYLLYGTRTTGRSDRGSPPIEAVWVDPAALPTLHNVEYALNVSVGGYDMRVQGYPDIWAASYPPMIMYGTTEADADRLAYWQERMTALLDAAGITNTATRAFFLARHRAADVASWAGLRHTPPVRAEVLWALQRMLSLFTCCVYGPAGGALANVEHLYVVQSYADTWEATIAAFDALSTWGPPEDRLGYPEYARHVAAGNGGESHLGEYDGQKVIVRSRGDATYAHALRCAANAQLAVQLLCPSIGAGDTLGRPYFASQDWPGITGVGSGISPENPNVLAVASTASVAPGAFHTQVAIGDWTGYNLAPAAELAALTVTGWYALPSYQRWDFAVDGGFTFV